MPCSSSSRMRGGIFMITVRVSRSRAANSVSAPGAAGFPVKLPFSDLIHGGGGCVAFWGLRRLACGTGQQRQRRLVGPVLGRLLAERWLVDLQGSFQLSKELVERLFVGFDRLTGHVEFLQQMLAPVGEFVPALLSRII